VIAVACNARAVPITLQRLPKEAPKEEVLRMQWMVFDGGDFVFQDRLHAMSISGGRIIDSDSSKAQVVDFAAKHREVPASEQQTALKAMLRALDIQEIGRAKRIVVHRPNKRKRNRRPGKRERKRQAKSTLLPPPPGPPARGRGDSAAVVQAESEIQMWGGSEWGSETDGGAGERARRLQAQGTEAEAEVAVQQRQQAAPRCPLTELAKRGRDVTSRFFLVFLPSPFFFRIGGF
jgi:hypothetical protein